MKSIGSEVFVALAAHDRIAFKDLRSDVNQRRAAIVNQALTSSDTWAIARYQGQVHELDQLNKVLDTAENKLKDI